MPLSMPQEASRRVGMKRKTGFLNNVVFSCFGFGQMRAERRSAWNGRFGQQFLQLTKHRHHHEKRKREMNVICFGDSNTYGYDPRGYFGGLYDVDGRWGDILAMETGWTISNMGQHLPFPSCPMTLGEWVPGQQLFDDSHTFAQLCQALAEQLDVRFVNAERCDISLAYDGVHFAEHLCRRPSGGTRMKRIIPFPLSVLLLTGCSGGTSDGFYEQITQETDKEMMDTQEVIILDAREQDEYDSGHIPGAVLLSVGSIDEETAATVIPEREPTVLVYCCSGNRSRTASSTLAGLGYTNIYVFGGINTWPYEIEP